MAVISKRSRRWILLAGAVAAVALLVLLTRDREPSCQGRSLSAWLQVYARELDDPPSDRKAEAAIRQIGTNALPFLVRWVRHESTGDALKRMVNAMLFRMPEASTPRALQRWADPELSEPKGVTAAKAFAVLGDQARPVIPELTKLMNDPAAPAGAETAVLALAGIGKAAVPVLSAQLANTNAPQRPLVALLFGNTPALATNADAIVPLLIHCLGESHERLRECAAGALGWRAALDASHAAEVVPALTNCLRADCPRNLRFSAVWALGAYGEQARAAVPLLRRLTEDPEELVRVEAAKALGRIAPATLTNAPPR